MTRPTPRIGVFGGTFDPPHLGHLIAAQEIHEQLALDRLFLMPAAIPPHKRDARLTPGDLRLEMLRAAVASDARFDVSELELGREGPSYSVDTLRLLRDRHPDAALFLAIGADQLAEFGSWREPDAIAELATLAVFARAGQSPDANVPWPVEVMDVPTVEISSTEIRRRVAVGRSIRYWVAPGVQAIIEREGLYRD